MPPQKLYASPRQVSGYTRAKQEASSQAGVLDWHTGGLSVSSEAVRLVSTDHDPRQLTHSTLL